MASAKDIVVQPISSKDANLLVKRIHYSGKVVSNSQLHFGVFIEKRMEGVMSFGCSMDKRKTQALVSGTGWNGFLELNRMAFSESLPRNSESRAISIAICLIKKHYPHIDWIISFADGTQCGDGTIYRASGFVLTQINKNTQLMKLSDGSVHHKLSFEATRPTKIQKKIRQKHGMEACSVSKLLKLENAKPLIGYQFRYIFFIDPESKKRLTCPIIPFSKIAEIGGGMYRGETRVKQAMTSDQLEQRQGSTDLHAPKLEAI